MQKIGIVCATDGELNPFLPHIDHTQVTKRALLTFYEGVINGVSVVALYSGACKVNAAIATQILIDTFHLTTVINAGVAGGMDERIHLFDTVISTQAAYHDMDDTILTQFHPWMPTIYFDADANLLELAKKSLNGNPTVHFGKMVTGEQFIKNNKRDYINQKYAPLSVDMETASVAHVCYVNQIPFLAIRSITDTATHIGIESFKKNCSLASVIAKDIVLTFLDVLNGSK